MNAFGNPVAWYRKAAARTRIAMTLIALAFVALVSMAPPPAIALETEQPEDSLTLERAVAVALKGNPELGALAARSSALAAVPPQVGALPDPMLSLTAMNLPTDSFDLDQEPMTQLQIGVSQNIPFPGKRQLRRDVAAHDFNAAQATYQEARDALTGAVRSAWWQLFSKHRALEIVARNQALMRDFIDIAQTKYTVGGGLQQDVLLAQLELSKLLDRESQLNAERRGAQAHLNGLLDRRPDHDVNLARVPPSVELPELPAENQLLAQARESRHLLNVQRELLHAARERVRLAERERYPDFRLGAGYGYRQGEDAMRGKGRSDLLNIVFAVNIPIYAKRKQHKAIEQRVSEREERAFALNRTARMIETQIGRKIAAYESRREQVQLLEGAIIPQAEQTVASMLAAYQVNEVDFLNVINGQISLYNAQINYWSLLADGKSALAELAAAVGQEALYE